MHAHQSRLQMILCTLNTFHVPGVTGILISECAINWLPVLSKSGAMTSLEHNLYRKNYSTTELYMCITCLESHCNEMWSNRHSGDNCVILHDIHVQRSICIKKKSTSYRTANIDPMFDAATNL